jgi:phytoene desaturase
MTADSDSRPHAAVIGSGFGGLAAAVRLGTRGYRVTVLERLDQPGGRARVFRQDGFTFDAGPTVITAPFLFEELWELCGRRLSDDVDLRPVHPFYRIRFDDGEVFDYSGSAELMIREIRKFSPSDVAGYEAFVRMSERIFRVGFQELGHVPFGSPWDMVRIAPAMVRLRSYLTVWQLASRYVRDPRLRQVLSFHPLLVGGNPFTTTSIYALIAFLERKWGVHFPIGGTGTLVQGLLKLIGELGGELRFHADVEQVLVDGRRARGVHLATGEEIRSDIVVSNADSAWLYRHMVPEQARTRWTDARIGRARYSMGLFVWYFGTGRRYDDVAHHTILLGPQYRGLLDDVFKEKRLAKDFSLYLHRPTATDPGMAPRGMDAFYVLSPVPNLEAGIDWKIRAEPYRQAIERALAETVLPGLASQVVTSRMLTPLDFRQELLSYRGAAFGLEPILRQSAYFRPHNRSRDVEGLYLVGAGTHPGAGVPGVLSSARVLDSVVPDPGELSP